MNRALNVGYFSNLWGFLQDTANGFTFAVQDGSLTVQAPSVSAEFAGAPDNAMAWND